MSSTDRFGIAIDLGTTTIAAALVDIPASRVIAANGGVNPQRQFGLDVVTRLEYACRSKANLRQLQAAVNEELAKIAADLTAQAGVRLADVGIIAVAGNPTMSQLLLGLPVDTLARPPYRPQTTAPRWLMTADLGWETNIPAYLFPSPGGFVGGDTVAFLFGLGFPESAARWPAPALFLDLGTNGEIVLQAGGRLYATSAAAGPAFEGGNLSCGMAAQPGAIDAVAVADGRLVLQTIAGKQPLGLCGSGVLDTIVLLRREGLLDAAGTLIEPGCIASPLGGRLADIDGVRSFVVYRDAMRVVALSQADIRQVQLAKAAVRAGIEVLFSRAGIAAADIARVVVTGSFGAAISLESLNALGVLTAAMLTKTEYVREGALAGVVRLVSRNGADAEVKKLAEALKIVPLSGTPLFERCFLEQIDFAGK